ncbi:MAG: DUF512 domain-containing protein [Peptococcaceae bacterium]|nr:DUF512 domain-containing protein [Peptococcaceae bacterium]
MGEIVRQKAPEMTVKDLVLESAARSNILPVISTCNVRCRFCSHGQNPPSVETRRMPAISMDLVDEALTLMDPGKPVVIGESVTRLMEGEPFVHPRFREILELTRNKLPRAEIRITTNGTMLDRETVDFLASLGGVVITLSLNSSSISLRKYLMNDPRAQTAVESPALLREAAVPCHGSVVAVPHLTGWEDLAGTLEFLDRNGAATVRVFLPGHTRFSPPGFRPPRELRRRLHEFITGIRFRLKVPVTLEPPVIEDLRAEVAGVMAGSPACRAGIRAGDTIASVNGIPARSRVDAFRRVLAGRNPSVEVIRGGEMAVVEIVKENGRPSGLVFDYDIDPAAVEKIAAAARRKGAREALLLTSELGYPAVKMGLERFSAGSPAVRIAAVKNRFFGGSIGCAGLLTVADMRDALIEYGTGADLVIVPGIAFDARGRDIAGRSCHELRVAGGPEVEAVWD